MNHSYWKLKKKIEQNTIERFTKASIRKSENKGLDPGEFTPLWDKSSISNDNRAKSVDVPIISGNKFKAKHPGVTKGEVDVTQTLVVSQDIKTGKMSQYILCLIPEKNIRHNIPYMVEKYENGKLIERINQLYPG